MYVRNIPTQWNEAQIKRERHLHFEWLMNEGMNNNLIYLDEFGINCWTAQTKGSAAIGKRAMGIAGRQGGQNLTFCLTICAQFGLVHVTYTIGVCTSVHFEHMLSEIEQRLLQRRIYYTCKQTTYNPPALMYGHELRYLTRR